MILSRICEEFGCPPSVAMNEPWELCLRIMETRAYIKTKAALDAADMADGRAAPTGWMADLVVDIEDELVLEEQREKIRLAPNERERAALQKRYETLKEKADIARRNRNA